MVDVFKISLKSIMKSKILLYILLLVSIITLSIQLTNEYFDGETRDTIITDFTNYRDTLDSVLDNYGYIDADIGLTNEEIELQSLYINQLESVLNVLRDLNENNMDIASDVIAFIENYHITYSQGYEFFNFEQINNYYERAVMIEEHNLVFMEEYRPHSSSLISIELFEIFLSPTTLVIFVLITFYITTVDERNRVNEWMRVQSLSMYQIIAGQLLSFITLLLIYFVMAVFISALPFLLTGNFNTVNYPVSLFVLGEYHVISAWKYLIYGWLGWVSMALLVISIYFAIYKLTMNFIVGIIGAIVVTYLLSLIRLVTPAYNYDVLNLIINYDEVLISESLFIILSLLLVIIFVVVILSFLVIHYVPTLIPLKFSTKNKYRPLFKSRRVFHITFLMTQKLRQRSFILFVGVLILIPVLHYSKVYDDYQQLDEDIFTILSDLQNTFTRTELFYSNELDAQERQLDEAIENEEESRVEILTEEVERTRESKEVYTELLASYAELLQITPEDGLVAAYNTFMSDYYDFTLNYEVIEQTPFGDMVNIYYHRYLNEHGIEQRPIGFLKYNNFDNVEKTPDEDNISRDFINLFRSHDDVATDAMFTLEQALKSHIFIIVLVTTILFLWVSMSDIYQPYKVYSFIFTQPVSYLRLTLSRLVFNILVTGMTVFISALMLFAVAAITGGVGRFDYPVIYYIHNEANHLINYSASVNAGFDIIPIWQVFTSCIVLFVSLFVMVILIFNTIGLFLRNHYVTMLVTIVLTLLGYVFGNYYINEDWMWLNPFIYFNIWDIADGWQSVYADNVRMNLTSGVVISSCVSLLLFAIHLLKKKKRMI